MSYHRFVSDDGQEYGSFETFEAVDGWYWIACYPGCLPEGEACGPFEMKTDAIEDARS